jgi:flagellar basal-body rod modification protein FlgD
MSDFLSLLPPGLEGIASTSTDSVAEERDRLGQEQFFELMVAQLQNQDPLKPLESNEFMGQIAQFSTVNGIQEMQSSIDQLAGSLQSSQALQASMLVGRDVLIPSNTARISAGGSVDGAVALNASTSELNVTIQAPNGEVVRHIQLGPQQAGTVRFKWDGLDDGGQAAPPGSYVIQAQAATEDGAAGVPAYVTARVESVTLNGPSQSPTLNLSGYGSIELNNVRELL